MKKNKRLLIIFFTATIFGLVLLNSAQFYTKTPNLKTDEEILRGGFRLINYEKKFIIISPTPKYPDSEFVRFFFNSDITVEKKIYLKKDSKIYSRESNILSDIQSILNGDIVTIKYTKEGDFTYLAKHITYRTYSE